VNLLGFTSKGVTVSPIACDLDALSAHCLLLDTGLARQGDAGAVLQGQQQDRDDVRELARLAHVFAYELERGELDRCGSAMQDAWLIKSKYCSTVGIDRLYRAAQRFGAWGGKLCGAGGGGFLLFLAPPERHAAIVQALGLRHVPIRVGVPGCQVVYS
jgi:D-glycero-alpha-D-manno-heptose-7-phosphate kinase